jgi:uncharacterized protein
MVEQYFPLGIAAGESFLGREKEIQQLKSNITHGIHTLLISPRRYGKTSLVKHVIELLKYPHVEIDLFVAQNEFSIEQKFLKGIQNIIGQIDTPEKWFHTLVTFFKKSQKIWRIGIQGLNLELTPENHNDIPENILEALSALEHVLSNKKKRAIIFVDEFQEIAHIKISKALEGTIRHFAQSSKYVIFIFSGSSQHLLKHIFDDKTRPLYALCDQIKLDRLLPSDYLNYLNSISKKTWKKNLPKSVLEKIFALTECHPRYVYYLCMKLWEHAISSGKIPTSEEVNKTWEILAQERLKDTRELISKKAPGQIKILSLISLGETQTLSGKNAQHKLGMSSSAIVQSIKILEQEDYIERTESGIYKIIDPLLKSTFVQYGSDYFQ